MFDVAIPTWKDNTKYDLEKHTQEYRIKKRGFKITSYSVDGFIYDINNTLFNQQNPEEYKKIDKSLQKHILVVSV